MCGCAVSRRYVDVCYCDMFSVVNVYLDHLKFCVVCVYGRRYVCCGEGAGRESTQFDNLTELVEFLDRHNVMVSVIQE